MGEDATQDHVSKYKKAISEAASSGQLAFQQWFCKSESLTETRVRGYWDFAVHVLTPTVISHLSKPEHKTVLEIGYGGGRLLNAACSFFGFAIGIDIHEEPIDIKHQNYALKVCDGKSIPLADGSIDFVYSFIVFMHLQSFEAFVSYLRESFRVLKHGGIAQLYFGITDKEPFLFHEAPANHASLIVNMTSALSESRKAGFEILDQGRSYKSVPDGYPDIIGQQGYMTLKKP